jgi:crotonobetainyl-CoA:carnitine CoA-transferase CaiB-like acyl-CoA transferase
VGISIADIAAGMYAFSNILAALLRRANTGEGAAIEVSLFDALAEWMGYAAYYTEYGGAAPERTGARHAAIAPYGPYSAGDGKVVYLGLQNEREWARFCEQVLGQPGLASDPRFASNSARVAHNDALTALVTAAFAELTAAEVVSRLEAAGIANARMNTVREFLDHEQLSARDRWRQIESPAGPLRALLPPFGIEGADPVMGPVPAVGEHTESILAELGIDPHTIAGWRARSVV